MTDVIINDTLPLTQAVAIAGQTVFSTNWTANYASDVVVFYTPFGNVADDATQLLATNLYTVQSIGTLQNVQITLINPASAGDQITITRMTPADRLNLYTNTNFTPTMLNNDFGILTLVDQQAQLVNQQVAPRYNYSQFLDIPGDTILPQLGANQFWAKDPTDSFIEALDINEIISGGTVTQVNTGLGLTGGPITDAGTISFAPMISNSFWGNITGVTALPTQVTTAYFLQSAKNLSDLTNVATAVANLGLTPGTNVQPYSAALTSIAALTTVANELIYTTAANTYAVITPLANSALISSGGNIPSWSQTLPANVQLNITQLGAQIQALNMGTHLINNVVDPVSAQDAATKNYVDAGGGAFLKLDGSSVMAGSINMNSHKIINLTNPSSADDAANKAYVDSTVGNYLPLSGGTMTGQIDMGNHKIINLTDPTLNQDAVNLEYLNTQLGLYLPLAGGTMTGAINMNSHKITSLTDPSNPQDAATKNYVDSVAIGFTVKAACQAATTGSNLNATYVNGASGIGATLTNAGSLAALVIDGYSVNTNDRLLIKDQSTTYQNGIYTATNVGSGAVAWILTRATDFDQPAKIQPGDLVIINLGTVNAGTSWLETATVSAVGTDPILFSQFTFSATAVLLKANNLSDVANKTTSFNNISPMTTKGDLIVYSTQNIRLAVGGSDGQILQVKSAAASGLGWSTATYPPTTTVNQILWSSATNTVTGLSTTAGGVLVTDASNIPQFLANPSSTGNILQSANGAIAAWSTPTYPSASGTSRKIIVSNGTNNVYSTETWAVPGTSGNVLTSDGTNWTSAAPVGVTLLTTKGDLFGFSTVNARVPVATGNGKVLQVDSSAAVGLSYSTPTYPSASGTAGQLLRSDGTNNLYSTSTYPNTNAINTLLYASAANVMSALATANNGLLVTGPTTGTPSILAGPGTTGNLLISNSAAAPSFTTFTYPTTVGATGSIHISDGTNIVSSTSLWPNTVGTSRKLVISNGTSNVYSTETYAVPGTSGNVLTSDGTNWISSAPAAVSQNPFICQCRLTLTSGLPVTTSDVTAATSVYLTPYKGNEIALFDGSSIWTTLTFTEITITVPSTTSTMYDVFVYNNSGTVTAETLVWTNDTTRATGLVLQNGIYVKSGATTRRYIGSFRTTNVSGQTEDSLVKRYVWNYYNRITRTMLAIDTTDTWNYSTAIFRQANGNTANQLDCVIGVSEDIVSINVNGLSVNSSSTVRQTGLGIGINSTSVNSAQIMNQQGCTITLGAQLISFYNNTLPVGRNFIVWLERGAGTDTQTWYGDGGTVVKQNGITGFLLA